MRKFLTIILALVLTASMFACSASADDLQTAVQEATQTVTFNPSVFQNGSAYNATTDANGQTIFTLKEAAIGVWTDNDNNTLDVYPRIIGGGSNPYVFQLAACYSGGPIGAQSFVIYTGSHVFTFTPTVTTTVENNVATELITMNLATEQTLQLIKDLATEKDTVTYVLYGNTRTVYGSFVLLNQNSLLNMYNDYINANGLKQDLTDAAAVNLCSVYDVAYVSGNNQKQTTQSYNNNYPYYYYYSGYDVDTWAANNLSDSEYLAYLYACGVVTSDDIEDWYNSGYLSREDCIAINGFLGYNAFADSSLDGNYDGQTEAGVAYQDKMYQEWLKSQNSSYYNNYYNDYYNNYYNNYYYDNHDGQTEEDVAMIDEAYYNWLYSQEGQGDLIDEQYSYYYNNNSYDNHDGQTEEDAAMIDQAYYEWLYSQEGQGDLIDEEYSAYYNNYNYDNHDGQTEEDVAMIDAAYNEWLKSQEGQGDVADLS